MKRFLCVLLAIFLLLGLMTPAAVASSGEEFRVGFSFWVEEETAGIWQSVEGVQIALRLNGLLLSSLTTDGWDSVHFVHYMFLEEGDIEQIDDHGLVVTLNQRFRFTAQIIYAPGFCLAGENGQEVQIDTFFISYTGAPILSAFQDWTLYPCTCNGTEPSLPFADVGTTDWFYPYVGNLFERNLMIGTSATTFSPNITFSRAMTAAVLYRMAYGDRASNIPYAENRALFADVDVNAWYSPYVAWAYDYGIMSPESSGRFAPGGDMTRERIAEIMFNFAQFMGHDTEPQLTLLWAEFEDTYQISPWAVTPLQWAVAHGLIIGRGDGTIAPLDLVTRAEATAILVRYIEAFMS